MRIPHCWKSHSAAHIYVNTSVILLVPIAMGSSCLLTMVIVAIASTHRGSYMSAHVLLNLLNKLRKRDKMRGLSSILLLFTMILINSIIQGHEC